MQDKNSYHALLNSIDQIRIGRIISQLQKTAKRIISSNFSEVISLLADISKEISELYIHEGSFKIGFTINSNKDDDKKVYYLDKLQNLGAALERASQDKTVEIQNILEQLSLTFSDPVFCINSQDPSTLARMIALLENNACYNEITIKYIDEMMLQKINTFLKEAADCNTKTIEGRGSLLYLVIVIGECTKKLSTKIKGDLVFARIFEISRNTISHLWDSTRLAGKIINIIEKADETMFNDIKRILSNYSVELKGSYSQEEWKGIKTIKRVVKSLLDMEEAKFILQNKDELIQVTNEFAKNYVGNVDQLSLLGDKFNKSFGNLLSFLSSGPKQNIKADSRYKDIKEEFSKLINSMAFTKKKLDAVISAVKVTNNSSLSKSNPELDNLNNGQAYIWKQLDLIRVLIERLKNITDQDLKVNPSYNELREIYSTHAEKHYFCLFILTAIGQVVRNVFTEADDHVLIFFEAADPELTVQFEFLRWVRNSLAHVSERIQNVDERGFIFDFFSNDLHLLPIHKHGGRRLEFSDYLTDMLVQLQKAKDAVKHYSGNKTKDKQNKFYDFLCNNQLLKAVFDIDQVLITKIYNQIYSAQASQVAAVKSASEKLFSRQILTLNVINDYKVRITRLAAEHNISIIGFFGELAVYGYTETMDNAGLLVEFDKPKVSLSVLAYFKNKMADLLNFRLKIVLKEQFVEYFRFENKHHLVADEIEKITQAYSFEKILSGYELHLTYVDGKYDEVIDTVNKNSANLDMVLQVPSYILELKAYRNYSLLHRLIEDIGYVSDENEKQKLILIFEKMLDKGANVDVKNKYGVTPLMCCAMDGYIDLASRLIKCDADLEIECEESYTALDYAIKYQKNEMASLLIDNGANCGFRESGRSALASAVAATNEEIFFFILAKAPLLNLNQRDENEFTLLHTALSSPYKSKNIIIELLKRGMVSDPIYCNDSRSCLSPIHWVYDQQEESGLLFLQAVQNTKFFDYAINGIYPIHLAVKHAHQIPDYATALQYIVQHSKNLNYEFEDARDTPLATAIKNRDISSVSLLVEAGADVNYKTYRLYDFAELINYEILCCLIKHGLAVDLAKFKIYLKHEKAIQFVDYCITAFEAVKNDDIALLKKLHETHGVPLNIYRRTKYKQVLIDYAKDCKKPACQLYLVEQGLMQHSEIRLESINLDVLLHGDVYKRMFNFIYTNDHKAFSKNINLLKDKLPVWLISKNKNIAARSLLSIAISERRVEIVKLILDHKLIDIDFPDADSELPLTIAINTKNMSLIKLVLSYKPQLFPLDAESVLFNLNIYNNQAITDLIFDNLSDTDKQKIKEEFLLHKFTYLGWVAAVKILLSRKLCDVNQVADNDPHYRLALGDMALHIACRNNKSEIVKLLLDQPEIKPTESNSSTLLSGGYTPLHYCADTGNIEIAELLLAHPAVRKNMETQSFLLFMTTGSLTPLELALEGGYYSFAKLLIENGAYVGKNLLVMILHSLKNNDLIFLEKIIKKITNIIVDIVGNSFHLDRFNQQDFVAINHLLSKPQVIQFIPTHVMDTVKKFVSARIHINQRTPITRIGMHAVKKQHKEDEPLDQPASSAATPNK